MPAGAPGDTPASGAQTMSDPASPPPSGLDPSEEGQHPGRVPWRLILPPLVVLLLIVGAFSALFIHNAAKATLPGGAEQATAGEGYWGTLALPAKAAPAIVLDNYLGRRVTLAQYRGRAVLVTFLYTHCPDVCPLIADNLRAVLNRLGPAAARAQVIAVSVDPSGDTPQSVAAFLRAHAMAGRMQYLIGSAAQLARTWAAWSVGSTRDTTSPELVSHSALVYGITASGQLKTIYPADFDPSQIVHDLPRLAAS